MVGVGAPGRAGALLFLFWAFGDILGKFMTDWDWPKVLVWSSTLEATDTVDNPCGWCQKWRLGAFQYLTHINFIPYAHSVFNCLILNSDNSLMLSWQRDGLFMSECLFYFWLSLQSLRKADIEIVTQISPCQLLFKWGNIGVVSFTHEQIT